MANNNLDLVDKLVMISDKARDKCFDSGDTETEELINDFESELIEYLNNSRAIT